MSSCKKLHEYECMGMYVCIHTPLLARDAHKMLFDLMWCDVV